MRILFSSTSGDGHLNPLLPLARALRSAGHDVAFAMAPEFGRRLDGLGFAFFPSGIGLDELNERTLVPHEELAALSPDLQIFVSRFAFADAPERMADLSTVVDEWLPDVVISEPCDLAAPIVADARDLPLVLHSFGRSMEAVHYESAMPYVEPLWRAAGSSPVPLCGVYGRWYVDICPPSLHDDVVPDWCQVLPLRPSAPQPPGPVPDWLSALPERPTVYVTLGTIFNHISRFPPVLAALEDLDCNVIVTIGGSNDPGALGHVPANAIIRQFVPQDVLLPRVDAMVGHGGSGSMLAGFAHGIPQLLLPIGADQVPNAKVAEREGLARVLLPADVTVEALREGVSALLTDAAYRARAADLAEEMAQMPGPDAVAAALVEAIGRTRTG